LGYTPLTFEQGFSETTASSEHNQNDGGGGSASFQSWQKIITGSASMINLRKVAITHTSGYSQAIHTGTASTYWASGWMTLPYPGGNDSWYIPTLPGTATVETVSTTHNAIDLLYPIRVENIISLDRAFYCADTELRLSIYGVHYRGHAESKSTWRIFLEKDGSTRDITDVLRVHFAGRLYKETLNGEPVVRSQEDKLEELDNYLSCCYLKKTTIEVEAEEVEE